MPVIDNNDLLIIIQEMFLGYMERKKSNTLYSSDRDIPKYLLKYYYRLDESERNLDDLKGNFVKHYIECESLIEDTHELFEKDGLKEMYDYIHSKEIDENFDIYTLIDLHKKLYSKAPYPDAGGQIRRDNVYLPTTGINLADWRDIRTELKILEPEVNDLVKIAPKVKDNEELLFDFIDRCVLLKCKLIKIHPFFDGNGRSIRGFINKLFLMAGLPSIYISVDENVQYRNAMQKAIGEEHDYKLIIQFYYYKLCDSIMELDINPKVCDSISIPQVVLEKAQKYQNLVLENNLISEEEMFVCDSIKKELESLGITSTIYSVSQFDKDKINHYFVVAYYKEKFDEGKILIDPFFKSKALNNEIIPNDSEESRVIAQSLFKVGAKNINTIDNKNYTRLFEDYEKKETAKNEEHAIVPVKKYPQKLPNHR